VRGPGRPRASVSGGPVSRVSMPSVRSLACFGAAAALLLGMAAAWAAAASLPESSRARFT